MHVAMRRSEWQAFGHRCRRHQRATLTYSNWKWRDLLEEWRFNYPFLEELSIFFESTSYFHTRRKLEEQIEAFHDDLTKRHPHFSHTFALQPVIDILFALDFWA
jgi:hypothetical protein